MRVPKHPPSHSELTETLYKLDPDTLHKIFTVQLNRKDEEYLHWDKLRFLTPPEGLTPQHWWCGIKLNRKDNYENINVVSGEKDFKFLNLKSHLKYLHHFDSDARGQILSTSKLSLGQKKQYVVNSLIEEAITSSQIEGAVTTRKIAKRLLTNKRQVKNKSEQMIINNFQTMERIVELKNEKLSIDLILEIHRRMTEDTLDNSADSGRLRKEDEEINVVVEDTGEILHTPPNAKFLEERLKKLCDFANAESPDFFIHPVIRAIIVHFWLAYDHPFVDGNGRTARALFFWAMLKYGYWLFEYISISNIILKSKKQYYESFLLTETDQNDLTYFINYHLKVIDLAIQELHNKISRKSEKVQSIKHEIDRLEFLNTRQKLILTHAIEHSNHSYSILEHQAKNQISYPTARKDLLELSKLKFFTAKKKRKNWNFKPVEDLENKIKNHG